MGRGYYAIDAKWIGLCFHTDNLLCNYKLCKYTASSLSRGLEREVAGPQPEDGFDRIHGSAPVDLGRSGASVRTATRRSTYLATFRALARKYPHLPPEKVLRDLADSTPGEEGKWFAVEAGVAALHWLVEGYGYEISNIDVRDAYIQTMRAAEAAGRPQEIRERIKTLVAAETFGERFVTKVLGKELGLA